MPQATKMFFKCAFDKQIHQFAGRLFPNEKGVAPRKKIKKKFAVTVSSGLECKLFEAVGACLRVVLKLTSVSHGFSSCFARWRAFQ